MFKRTAVLLAATLAIVGTLRAESGSSSSGKTDLDSINMMLDYNKRMVSMTENYLRDRAKIPADYQAVSDKEFLRKAKAEKMTPAPKKAEAAPAKAPAKTETKAAVPAKAAAPAPAPAKSPAKNSSIFSMKK